MGIIIFLTACMSNTTQPNSISDADKIATIVAATLSAATLQAPPTEIPATPTITPFPGIPVSYTKAAQLFASNRKVIHFRNGQGVRYITEFAQYPAPINNHDVFYYFSGLTDNKKFYIMIILPINTNQLPENAQTVKTQPSDMQQYYLNITTLLNNTQADAFIPNIDLLDTLISSINIIEK